ncbi:hypothetical protein Tco_0987268 [Tanacetum coccineum]
MQKGGFSLRDWHGFVYLTKVLMTSKVLTTRPACRPSLASCLSSHEESLPSVPDAYAIAVSDVPGYGSRAHTHDHGGSEAPDRSPDSILSSEPKLLGKHKPPPIPSILSLGESSYPPISLAVELSLISYQEPRVDKHNLLRGGCSDSGISSLRSTSGGMYRDGGSGGSGGDGNAAVTASIRA